MVFPLVPVALMAVGGLAGVGAKDILDNILGTSKKEATVNNQSSLNYSPSTQNTITSRTVMPYAYYSPTNTTTTNTANTEAWTYAPAYSVQISSPNAQANPTLTKKDVATATAKGEATSTPTITTPSNDYTTGTQSPTSSSTPSIANATGLDMNKMVLIGAIALGAYLLLKKK